MGAWFLHSACWVEWFALLPTFSYTNVAKDDWTSLTDCVKWTYQQLFVVNFMPWEIVVKKEISGVSQNVSLQNKRNWFLARHLFFARKQKDEGVAENRSWPCDASFCERKIFLHQRVQHSSKNFVDRRNYLFHI